MDGVSEALLDRKLPDVLTEFNDETGVYRGAIKNIQLHYYSKGGKLKFSGSIHKFAKGNNYSRYTYSEAVVTLQDLGDLLEIVPLTEFRISNIEVGVNLQLSESPIKYIKTIKQYKGHEFLPMTPRGIKILGCRCSMSEYEIKFYDKTADHIAENRVKVKDRDKIPKNILRYEVKLSRKQLITFGFPNPTVANLMTKRYAIFFVWILRSIFEEIVFFDSSLDITKIPHKDSKALDKKVKEYIFVTSDAFDAYLEYTKMQYGEDALKKAVRYKARLLKKMQPFMLGKYESEVKGKFFDEIAIVHDYKRATRKV